MLPIVYSVVSRSSLVLSDHSTQKGNFAEVTEKVLEKVPEHDTKLSYQYDKYFFHFISQSGVTYLCMAEASFPRRVAFAYLNEMKEEFLSQYNLNDIDTAPAYGMATFDKDIAKLVDYYSQSNVDRLQRVQDEVESVKEIMVQNIGKVLDRGEQIEVLVDKTESLNEQAFQFKRKATYLKRKMWWKNQKMIALCVLVVLLVIYFITASACGGLSLPCTRS